jgi:hypothetical protein
MRDDHTGQVALGPGHTESLGTAPEFKRSALAVIQPCKAALSCRI